MIGVRGKLQGVRAEGVASTLPREKTVFIRSKPRRKIERRVETLGQTGKWSGKYHEWLLRTRCGRKGKGGKEKRDKRNGHGRVGA